MGTQNGLWPWGILIHTLELKLQPFEVIPYICIGSHAFAMFSAHALREEWGHIRVHINVTTIPILVKIDVYIGCLLALYGSTMHPPQLCGGFWTIFFLLSVWSPCYTLSRKKNNKIIRGGTGSSWGHNFYMGTQNGSKHKIWWRM